jgi:hypothetical protein
MPELNMLGQSDARLRFGVLMWALIATTSTCAAQVKKSNPSSRGVSMGSPSIVLRSTNILLIELITVKPGDWAPSRPGLMSRNVDLSLRISEILRGKIEPSPVSPIHIAVAQTDYAGLLRMQPLTGAWSGVKLEPGASLVIFSHTDSPQVETILKEPACIRVIPAQPVIAGLRILARAEAENLPLSGTLALAVPEIPQLDPAFADFLWGRYGGQAIASQREFDLLMDFSERKGFNPATRQALLKGGYDLVGMHGEATPERAQRLALAMCRTLLMPEAADLHENLIDTYLPNLLGITSELPRQTASKVFQGHETERSALREFLHQHGTDADASALLTWLNAP